MGAGVYGHPLMHMLCHPASPPPSQPDSPAKSLAQQKKGFGCAGFATDFYPDFPPQIRFPTFAFFYRDWLLYTRVNI